MSTVTLTEIKAAHAKLAEMIASFEQASAPERTLVLPEAYIELAAGELYAGVILADDGTIEHHLVLLPDTAEKLTWQAAVDWAKSAGGDLPTRREQSLLFANLKDQFETAWYWSSESHESNGSAAWGQYFDNGFQGYDHKSSEGRARAVRRFTA